ncbi:MAG: carboxypeptidase regulatory-like domain-containing protein [Synechococcaceae cyanobacterium SM2_3_60]|nr:carboxypeptidase regulatory-like domain-containing protein [Synechococcaceae cyanobacterium SM2_3_60]
MAGQVLDVAGNPVSEGELRLLAQGRSNVDSRSLNLLPDGSFLVADLPPGLYLADIVVPGFPLISTQIDVRSGFVTTRDIRLPPGRPDTAAEGIGLLPDGLTFSDELAYRLLDTVQSLAGESTP